MSSAKEIAELLAQQDGFSVEELIRELQSKVDEDKKDAPPGLDEELVKELQSDEEPSPEEVAVDYEPVQSGSTADIIRGQLRVAARVGAPEIPTGSESFAVQDGPKKKIPLVPIPSPTPVPFNRNTLPAKNKSVVQQAIAKKLGIDPETLTNRAKAAESKIAFFSANRTKIEADRAVRDAQRAQEMREQAGPLIIQMVQRRVEIANEEAQNRIRKTVKRRDLLGNLYVDGKVTVSHEFDGHRIFQNENVEIVVYPPQYRTIQTNNRRYRLPLPWVAFNHIVYDRNNSKRQRRQLRNGTLRQRADRALSHHIFVGFSGEPLDNMDAMVYPPQLPHIYDNFSICMGPIPIEGIYKHREREARDRERNRNEPRRAQQRREPTTEDFIDAFWNNRFVYEERGPLRFIDWQEIPLDEILNQNWAIGAGTPLHRFPPNVASYEDFFE